MADQENLADDDLTYPAEDVEKIVQDTCEEILREASWEEAKVPQWINDICESVTKKLI